MPESTFNYVGSELDLFAAATVWKSYVRRRVRPYLGREVLEVGAGHGGTTRVLCSGAAARWVCLEPDAELAGRLARSIADGSSPACCRVVVGTLEQVEDLPPFDTVLYMDVLEHIEDDRGEMSRATGRLAPGGHLVVLAPAHQWLFTPFDRAIGHFRRYTRASLRAVSPEGTDLVRLIYLDSVGLLASLGNRLVLNRSMPNPGQIALWDKVMVPVSKVIDPLIGGSFGKSVIGVWRKPPPGRAYDQRSNHA
jgi:SAM-dependent methyltransferase